MVEQPVLAEYPFEPKYHKVNGHKMSYLDEGEGPVVVLVHGNPSWSYLYRNLVKILKHNYRVIVPDHIGCGRSTKPKGYKYTLASRIADLTSLLDNLKIERCSIGVHDWGGAIGLGWAGQNAEKIDKIIVFNTAAFFVARIPLRIRVCKWPIVGKIMVRGFNIFAGLAVKMAVVEPMTREVAKSFVSPYNSWKNRIATHLFVVDIPEDPSHVSWQTLVDVENNLQNLTDKPMLICWGGQDFCFNDQFYEEWTKRFPQAKRHYFKDAGHYVLEDAFTEISPLVENFLP